MEVFVMLDRSRHIWGVFSSLDAALQDHRDAMDDSELEESTLSQVTETFWSIDDQNMYIEKHEVT